MSSGFDSTAFANGLLGKIVSQNKTSQTELEKGQAEQFAGFQAAAKEYDSAKQTLSDKSYKIDALANIISGGKPNPAAYATARDAVEMGYTGTEHLPFVKDAYDRTYGDMQHNPEKWTGQKPQSNDPYKQNISNLQNSSGYTKDTNPDQSSILNKFGDVHSSQERENIRNKTYDRPYAGLPGAEWGSPEPVEMRQLGNKAKAVAGAQDEVAQGRENALGIKLGLTGASGAGAGQTSAAMPSTGMGQPTQNAEGAVPGSPQPVSPISVAAADLQPPGEQANGQPPAGPQGTNAGISLPGPAPSEAGAQAPAPPVPDLSPKAPEPIIVQTDKGPVQVDPKTHLNENYLSAVEAKDPIAGHMVRMIANYDILPPNQAMRPDKEGNPSPMFEYLVAAKQANPNFSMTNYNALVKLKQQYIDPNGVAQKQFQAIATGLSHLGMAQQAGQLLENSNVQALNSFANKAGAQAGATPLVTYQNIIARLAPEIVSSYVAGAGTEVDRTEASKNLSESLSGPQREAALSSTAHLLYGKLMPLQNTWDQNFPNEAGRDFLPPNAHAVLQGMGVDENDKTPYLTAGGAGKAAQGKTQAGGKAPDFSHLWSQ